MQPEARQSRSRSKAPNLHGGKEIEFNLGGDAMGGGMIGGGDGGEDANIKVTGLQVNAGGTQVR